MGYGTQTMKLVVKYFNGDFPCSEDSINGGSSDSGSEVGTKV